MGKFQSDLRVIASIYPGDIKKIQLNHGPDSRVGGPRCTTYWIPPVPKGRRAETLEIRDMFEEIFDLMASAGNRMAKMTKLVTCDEIRQHLIQQWAGNIPGLPSGAAPGIMAIQGTYPTQEELKQMKDMQFMFYEYMFQEGEKLEHANDRRHISQVMRDACSYLGKKRTWANIDSTHEEAQCPWCQSNIPPQAIVCAQCRRQVRAAPKELAELGTVVDVPSVQSEVTV